MIPALRWAAMTAILTFQWEVTDNVTTSQDSVHKPHFFVKEKGEPKRYRAEVLPLTTSLTPYR